jgi:hypothetical protein
MMDIVCFSCKKKFGRFEKQTNKKIILRAGYTPPNGMSDNDTLCQECSNEIRRIQIQGNKINERVGLAGQIIVCLIFPIVAFWRIKKLQRFLKYYFILMAIIITVMIIPSIIDEQSDVAMAFILGGFMIIYFGLWVIPVIWIISWTKDYNETAI